MRSDHGGLPAKRADTPSLLERLAAIVGSDGMLVGDDVRSRAEGWSSPAPCRALAILRPRSTDEVAAVLRLCNSLGQPVVPFGGGTGLVAGAVAGDGELLLSLERMRTIEGIDLVGRTATVQGGATIQAVQQAAESVGLFFPLDLGARGSATVGGAVATNAGGNRVIRYGMMREQVLGLEVVLADGTILSSMNRLIKNNAGYDLRQLFIGTEGTLGVVTRAVLRLREASLSQDVALLALSESADLATVLRTVDRGLGGGLSAFEVMWQNFYALVTSRKGGSALPLPSGFPYYCLVESMGGSPAEDRARMEAVLAQLLESGEVADAVLAESRSQALGIWALRDDVERLIELGPVFLFDVGLPIQCIDRYIAAIRAALSARWPAGCCIVWGHVGDGNLHLCVAVQDGSSEARLAVEQIVYEPLEPIGGTVSAEHGIGTEKRPYLRLSRSTAEILTMRTLKHAFDPVGILNPGKVLPAD